MAKKNLLKIPLSVRRRLTRLGADEVVAGYSRTFTSSELRDGMLLHLGVALTDDGLNLSEAIVPAETIGKYSNRNVNGYEVVRRDLPKETHFNAVEAPDWGDASNGTHTVYLPYEKFPRDYYGPQLTPINVAAPNIQSGAQTYTLVFEVGRVLKTDDDQFETHLLEDLNLLQENVGGCGVQRSGASFADYMSGLTVAWEVLPPGTREEAVVRLFKFRQPTQKERTGVEERYDFLMSLNPAKLVYGMSGIQRYFGALIADDLVVFENIEYGNAIYIMFGNWQELSKRSRTELLSGRFGTNFERVPHAPGWKGKVKGTIKTRLKSAIATA